MATAALQPAGVDPLRPRRPELLGRGALLALAVHGLLLLALAAGVNWRQRTPEAFSAELWSALPQVAAPRAVEPEPPAPEPRPTPPQAAPAPTPPAPARTDADIALERAKQRAEQQAREAEERRQQELKRQRDREAEAERRRKAESEALARQRELQQRRQAEAEQRRRQEEAEKRQAAALEAQRKANLERMLGQAGATGTPDSRGDAARSSGPSASYAGKIVAAIKPNIVFPDRLPGTLETVVEVRAAASGTVLSRRVVKSSGNAAWDEAVLRAIDRTRVLPRDTDGRVPSTIEIAFTPE